MPHEKENIGPIENESTVAKNANNACYSTAVCNTRYLMADNIGLEIANKSTAAAQKNLLMETVIGIDLGTTYSCVSVWRNGKAEVVRNELGERTTPSYVAFTKGEVLIGKPAQEQSEINPENTIFNVKRLMGQPFHASDVQKDKDLFPFKIIQKDKKPAIVVESCGKSETFWPEEISAMLLRKLRKNAEQYLGTSVCKAVITVPAHFNFLQREATKIAGELAGLEVIFIMSEPTAAALAYGIDGNTKKYKNILVFDLGGGTFDVSILSIGDLVLEVANTGGNKHLGGEDFVQKLMDHCLIDIQKSIQNADVLKTDMESMQRLRTACESTKINLSSKLQHQINLNGLFEGKRFEKKISRVQFNEMNKKYFEETLTTVKNVLEGAKMKKNEIDEIVLIGGSTRIPKIHEMMASFFNDQQLSGTIDPDEAVAIGAVTRGATILAQNSKMSDDLGQWIFNDVCPYSLSFRVKSSETGQHYLKKLIERNSNLPCSGEAVVGNCSDNQKNARIRIFEGEGTVPAQNNFLGEFVLMNIASAPRGKLEIKVKFELNTGGILKASAIDELSGSTAENTQLVTLIGSLTKSEIQNMMKRLDWYDSLAVEREEWLKNRHDLETVCNDLISFSESVPNDPQNAKIGEECHRIHKWLEEDDNAILPPVEYAKHLQTLKRQLCNPEHIPFRAKIFRICNEKGFDWTCNQCQHYNFPSLTKCGSCNAPATQKN